MESHGDPVEFVTEVAVQWSKRLKEHVTALLVAQLMADLHRVRHTRTPAPEHLVHIAGYEEIARRINEDRSDNTDA